MVRTTKLSPVSKCTIDIMRQITSPNQKFQEYFIKHYTEYMDFVLPGTDNRIKNRVMTLEDLFLIRRKNGGVWPCLIFSLLSMRSAGQMPAKDHFRVFEI